MEFTIITLFPEIFSSFLNESLIAKAIEEKIIKMNFINPRDFAEDRHKRVDDAPYGGGPGMVLMAKPFMAAIKKVKKFDSKIIFLTPSGTKLNQGKVEKLSCKKHLIFVCGRYEGLDQRVIDSLVDEEISIGDYIVNGGEVPAMVLIEAVSRLQAGFMHSEESLSEESHSFGFLEYPHYTRPSEIDGLKVPDVLLSGCHTSIANWRQKESLKRTLFRRPDLIEKKQLTEKEKILINELSKKSN